MRLVGAIALVAFVVGCARPRGATLYPRVPGQEPLESEGARLIAADAARARAAGAGPFAILATGAGAPGDNLGGRATVTNVDCALFMARGGKAVEDLDLFVYSDDGTVLGEDETSNRTANVVICPPHPERLYAFGRVASGHGLFAVSMQMVAPRLANIVASAMGVEGTPGQERLNDDGWPGLDAAIGLHRQQLRGQFRDVQRSAVPVDPRMPTRISASVGSHQCVDILVVPSDEVAFLELTVLDSEGRILGRAPSDVGVQAAVVCSEVPAEITLELQARAGRGLAAVVTSLVDDPQSLDAPGTVILRNPNPPTSLDQAERTLAGALSRQGYAPPVSIRTGTTVVGKRSSLDVDLPAGCSRVDVVPGAPSTGVEAWLWSARGSLVAHDDGGARATLFGCESGRARVDIESAVRAGPFAVEVRPTLDAPAIFRDHPVAAARALMRLDAAGRLDVSSKALPVRVLTLSPETTSADELRIPAGRCVDVALGLSSGAEGADLRLVNSDDKSEVAFSRGTYSALATACSLGTTTPLAIRIEARASAGSSQALLVSRQRIETPP